MSGVADGAVGVHGTEIEVLKLAVSRKDPIGVCHLPRSLLFAPTPLIIRCWVLRKVPDPRDPRSKRYPLAAVLAVAV